MLVDVNDKAVGLLGSLSIHSIRAEALDVHWVHFNSLAHERRFIDGDIKPSLVLTALLEFDGGNLVLVVEFKCTIDRSCSDGKSWYS